MVDKLYKCSIILVLSAILLGVSPAWDDSGYYDGTVAINVHRASDEQCARLDKIAFQLSRIADATEYRTAWETMNWGTLGHKQFKIHPTNRQLKK